MTEKMFFDTDCLSSFLWVGREDIILLRYHGRIVIPEYVYDEFCRRGVEHLLRILDNMILTRAVIKMNIEHGTDEARLFRELTKNPRNGMPVIGNGEASALVLAKFNHGIIASNNLKDITNYAQEFDLQILTTADILREAYATEYITLSEADDIWKHMLAKRRRLPASSFSEYLRML